MNINRSSYYKWIKNKNVEKDYIESRKELMELVKIIHKSRPSYGYRRINAVIKSKIGWIVSDLQVHKCCKFLQITSKAKHYKYKKTGLESKKFPNIVNGNWKATRPMQIIASDTTAIGFEGKAYEWTYYVDIFNNEIVGSAIGKFYYGNNIQTHHEALKSMLKAKIKRGYKDVETILHTDQGTIYSSPAFQNIHKNYTITRSMSRAGTPTDNPVIEALNGWLKEEFKMDINKKDYKNIHDYIKAAVIYINGERPSSKTNYKAPVQYRNELGFS
jgi:transposase InsO family protein